MARREVRFAPDAEEDFVRLYEFLAEKDVAAAERAFAAFRTAFSFAAQFPYSCRVAEGSSFVRECVVSFGRTGYVAAFEIADDFILVLALRHQREDDFH